MTYKQTKADKLASFFVFLLVLFIAGCGNGNSSGDQNNASTPTVVRGALQVLSSTPGNDATKVDRNASLEIIFNRDLNAASATVPNVSVQNSSGIIIPINLEADGNKLTVSFSQRLARGATYIVTSNGIQGRAGETLADGRLLSFTTTPEKEWSNSYQISEGESNSRPHVTLDSNGNAIAAWQQNGETSGSIMVSRYVHGRGWNQPELLHSSAGAPGQVQIAYINDEQAVAVWGLSDARCCIGLYSSVYTAGKGWEIPYRIDSLVDFSPNQLYSVSGQLPSISTDHAGTGHIVWIQNSMANNSAWTRTYTTENGWGSVENLGAFPSSMDRPNGAINKRGDAFTVFTTTNLGTIFRAAISVYQRSNTESWAFAGHAGSYPSIDFESRHPLVVTDEAGNATIVWLRTEASGSKVYAGRVSKAGVLEKERNITSASGEATQPKMAIDPAGNVTVTWSQNMDGKINIYASRYTEPTGWQPADVIATDIKYEDMTEPQIINGFGYKVRSLDRSFTPPQVAADNEGNVLIVWLQKDEAKVNVYSRRYVPSLGWETARLHSNQSGDAYTPQVAFGTSGEATIVWERREGATSSIFTSNFD